MTSPEPVTTGESSTTPPAPTTGIDAQPTSTDTSTTSVLQSSSSGDAETTSAAPDVSTGLISGCGDGVVDPGEECDESLIGNDDSRYCTADCTLNVCGDGKLFLDWELCDDGPGNGDEYGALCSSECKPGARCGDHKLQPEFETCDLGRDNGGMKGDEQGILCDASCRAQQLRGFVTSAAFTGDLGGLFGADLKCRAAAAAAGLPEPERFHALLSTGAVDAKTRFAAVAAAVPYVLVTGKKFAANFSSLMSDGPLGEGILMTETGAALYSKNVATNTAPGGLRFSPDQHCQDWTSDAAIYKGRVGLNALPANSPDVPVWKAEQWWISALSNHCDKADIHLYYLEI